MFPVVAEVLCHGTTGVGRQELQGSRLGKNQGEFLSKKRQQSSCKKCEIKKKEQMCDYSLETIYSILYIYSVYIYIYIYSISRQGLQAVN